MIDAPSAFNPGIKTIYDKLTEDVRGEVSAMRGDFMAYAGPFAVAYARREDLWDPYFKLYGKITAQVSCTSVQYVAMLDPTVPVDQRDDVIADNSGDIVKGYRNHPSYNAHLYLQRARDKAARDARKKEGGQQQQGRRAMPALERLARTLKTVVQVIRTRDLDTFWTDLGKEMDLDADGLNRLKQRVATSQPILELPRLPENRRFAGHVLRVVQPNAEAEAAAEPEARRNVGRGARKRAAAA